MYLKGANVNKNELISKVADDTELSKSDAAKAVDSIFDSITGELKSGGDIRLVGFGTFLVTKRKARKWFEEKASWQFRSREEASKANIGVQRESTCSRERKIPTRGKNEWCED